MTRALADVSLRPRDLERVDTGGLQRYRLTERGVAKVEALMGEEMQRQAQELAGIYEQLSELALVVGADNLRDGLALAVEAAKVGLATPDEIAEMASTYRLVQAYGLDRSDLRDLAVIALRHAQKGAAQ